MYKRQEQKLIQEYVALYSEKKEESQQDKDKIFIKMNQKYDFKKDSIIAQLLVFYPTLKSSPLECYNEEQQKQLLDGKSIIADVAMADGRHSKAATSAIPVNIYMARTACPLIFDNSLTGFKSW